MPPLKGTLGQILVNEPLPEQLRDYSRVLDKKGLGDLLRTIAEQYPDQYRDVSKRLADIGRLAATEFGGNSFGLAHMRKAKSAIAINKQIQTQLAKVLGRDDLTDEQRHQAIIRVVGKYQEQQMDDIYRESLEEKNPLAYQIMSGSRGNKMNLSSLRGSDMLYSDHHDQVIPLPVLHSFSQGLSPAEYWAGTYGARKGVMATKFATRDAGYLSKQINQISHRLMVVDLDGDGDPDGVRGMPVDTDDMDNEGSLLARDIGPYRRNTALTPKILKDLKTRGHNRILVRSPLVGGSPEGGVYARDVGVRERGGLPGRGEMVGMLAAQALSEPLSQSQLSAKHSGGVAGQEKGLSGFPAINQLIQTPKHFSGGAAHAEMDGRVEDVSEAPAGGYYVTVAGQKHYVASGFDLKVKKGDEVEAGDVLSEGLPNPAKIVEHKGIGEGRKYFVSAMRQAFKSAGLKANRRNLELLSRGVINHVRLTEETDHHVPDDVVPYSTLEHTYTPREDHKIVDPKRAVGQYLEKPVLHYSIGTKVRPSVLKELAEFGINQVAVHPDPPPFQPEMIRGMSSLAHDPDWMTRMYGSGLKGSLLESVHRGGKSTELGTSFVPGLSRAVDFGRVGMIRQPEPTTKPDLLAEKNKPVQPGTVMPQPTARQQPVKNPQKDNSKEPSSLMSSLFKWSKDRRLHQEKKALSADPTKPTSSTNQPATTQPKPVESKYDPGKDYIAGTASLDINRRKGSIIGNLPSTPSGSTTPPPVQTMQSPPPVTNYSQPVAPEVGHFSPQGGYIPGQNEQVPQAQEPQAQEPQAQEPQAQEPQVQEPQAQETQTQEENRPLTPLETAQQFKIDATNKLNAGSMATGSVSAATGLTSGIYKARGLAQLSKDLLPVSPKGWNMMVKAKQFGNVASKFNAASTILGTGVGALEAGYAALGLNDDANDPEWEATKEKARGHGPSGPVSFDPNATGWDRYAKNQQLKFYNNFDWRADNWKDVIDNPVVGLISQFSNPVGTIAGTAETLKDTNRAVVDTASNLYHNSVQAEKNRENIGVVDNNRKDLIQKLESSPNLNPSGQQDLENLKKQESMTPAERELQDMNAFEAGVHTLTSHRAATPREIVNGKAFNMFTGRPIRFNNWFGWGSN